MDDCVFQLHAFSKIMDLLVIDILVFGSNIIVVEILFVIAAMLILCVRQTRMKRIVFDCCLKIEFKMSPVKITIFVVFI